MSCLSSFGRPIWGSSCWLWGQRGQNPSAQLHPRCNFSAAQTAEPPRKEFPSLIPGSQARPADIFLLDCERGRPTALDVTVISTLQPLTLQGAALTPGHALAVGENRKMAMHASQCQAVGLSFVPLVIESLWGWSDLAAKTLSSIGHLLGQRLGILPPDSVSEVCNFTLEGERLSMATLISNLAVFYFIFVFCVLFVLYCLVFFFQLCILLCVSCAIPKNQGYATRVCVGRRKCNPCTQRIALWSVKPRRAYAGKGVCVYTCLRPCPGPPDYVINYSSVCITLDAVLGM